MNRLINPIKRTLLTLMTLIILLIIGGTIFIEKEKVDTLTFLVYSFYPTPFICMASFVISSFFLSVLGKETQNSNYCNLNNSNQLGVIYLFLYKFTLNKICGTLKQRSIDYKRWKQKNR